MKKLPVALSLFMLVVALGWGACKKDDKPDYLANVDCTGIVSDQNTYTKSIKAIMNASCATVGCHDALAQSGGYNLSTYAGTKATFESGSGLCSINHGDECQQMPQGGAKLSQTTITVISCWAKNGYKE